MPEEISLSSLDLRIQKQVENAEATLKKGNPSYAMDVCGKILESHPECLEVRKILRRAQKSSFATKSSFLTKAIGGMTNPGFLFGGVGVVKKDPHKAIVMADKMLKANPHYTTALKLLGEAAEAHGLKMTTIFAYEEIRELEPNNIENLLQLGRAYVEGEEPKKAVQIGDEILTKRPNFAEAETLIKHASVALTVKGGWEDEEKKKGQLATNIREQESRIDRTEEVMERMVKEMREKIVTDPENLNHRRTLIDNLRRLGRIDEAIAAVQDSRTTNAGSADVTLERLEGELQMDKLRAQIAEKEKELESQPDNEELKAEVKKLNASFLKHRLTRAKDLVERYPNDFTYRFGYGEILLENGDYDQAIAQFQLAQRNPKVRLKALQNTGLAFRAKKQYDFAIEQLQKAKEELPTLNDQKKEVIYDLGLCYEELGQMDKAIGEYRTIYSADISYRDVADKINAFYKT